MSRLTENQLLESIAISSGILSGNTMTLGNLTRYQLLEKISINLNQLVSNQISNSETTILLDVNAETWTDICDKSVSDFYILNSEMLDVTDSFEYRQFNNKWQIYSLVSQSNLQVLLS